MSESYKERFDSAMGHLGISSLGELNPEDQKPFFAFVDDLKEGLSAAQKKLPPALQKAIMKKMKAPMPKEPDTTTMKDAPKAKEGMKAVVKTKQVTENKRYLQTKPGSLEEAVLKTRGLVK